MNKNRGETWGGRRQAIFLLFLLLLLKSFTEQLLYTNFCIYLGEGQMQALRSREARGVKWRAGASTEGKQNGQSEVMWVNTLPWELDASRGLGT